MRIETGALLLALLPGLAAAETYSLKATPQTIVWGYYSAAATPVLTIKSGDRVPFDTLITSSPMALEKAGVAPDQIERLLRDIVQTVTDRPCAR